VVAAPQSLRDAGVIGDGARAAARSEKGAPMPCKLVTCPESAHLEMIAFDDTPVGVLIDACTKFPLGCEMGCARTCAARLDRRYRALDELHVGDTTTFALRLPDGQ
jgi:hypothetical protein